MLNNTQIKRRIRTWIVLFIVCLILSGITAFPIETELTFLMNHSSGFPNILKIWLEDVYNEVKVTNINFPHLSYGTDWLAFSHIVIATVFIGPLIDPVKNIWVIQFGMIACIMVFPLAMIAGAIREIPFFWRLIDCSFGMIGFIPLYITHKNIRLLEQQNKKY